MTPVPASHTCPACLDPRPRFWFDKVTEQGTYSLHKCGRCGGAFVLPRPTQAEMDAVYATESYMNADLADARVLLDELLRSEERYPNSLLDAARMVGHCRELVGGKRFLDIGAGFGFFSKEAARLGFEVTALEPAPRSREVFALMNGFEALPRMLDAAFVEGHAGAFDAVLLSQVLEHIPDLDLAATWIGDLLAPGGIAALAVPRFGSAVSRLQGRRDMFISPPEHLNYFTPRAMSALFERHGFQFLRRDSISRFDPERVRRRVPGGAGAVATAALGAGLAMADRAGLGMYLNSYFRKG